MKKEDLLLLKEKISKLSDLEQKQRDIYLRNLANGTIQGPLTGYASIDKPWLKYHTEDAIMLDFEPMSAYQLMHKNNLGHENEVMLEYFGKEITFGQAFEKIDIVAKALLEFGVKKGDVVIMSLANCPEAAYLFYALNKIGAIVDTIDPRYSKQNILESVEESNAKFFFGIDMMVPNLTVLPSDVKVVSVSPYNSMPFLLKTLLSLKSKNNDKNINNIISWNKFFELGVKSNIVDVPDVFEPEVGSIICHTGGSTGTPKGVEMTNEQFNGLIYQLLNNNVGLDRGKSFLNILPPFVAMGLDDGLHLAACAGIKQHLIPSINPDDFGKLVLKYKPNMVLCGPIHCNAMMADKRLSKADLSYIDVIMYGGGEYADTKQEEFNKFIHDRGCKVNLHNGYGATETASGSSCQKDTCYKVGSAGAPYIGCVDGIFDHDTQEEICGYNNVGELYITGPTLMNGYYGVRADETSDVIYTDEFGTRWYKTGDLAHFDEDGMLFIDGRIKRMITRRAYKIYPQYVEQLILKNSYIKEAAVVGIPDPEDLFIPVANIVLKDEFRENDDVKQSVIDYCNDVIAKEISEAALMAGFNFLDELPKTGIGKLDFKALEKLGIISNDDKIMQRRYNLS